MIVATFTMALREIRRNTLRSLLTALGIVIGVAAVITLVTVGQLATQKVTGDIAKLGNNLLVIVPGSLRRGPAAVTAPPLTPGDARAIQSQVAAAAGVAPTTTRAALAVYGHTNYNTVVTGTTNAYFEVRAFKLGEGRVFSASELSGGAAVCVLGATARRELFHRQRALGASVRIGRFACTVIGLLEAKGSATVGGDQDDVIVLPLLTVQRRLAGTTDLSSIFVSAATDRVTTRAKTQIESLLRERRRIGPAQEADFAVQDMKEITATLGRVTSILTALLAAIAGVSLLVGGIGIMNIMLVSVTERTREIGIRLSIGALGRDVLLQFLVEAIVLSSLGGVLGLALGLAGSFGIAHALSLPFLFVPWVTVLAFVFSVTVGVVFGYFPARRAAALDPIVALRHE